MGIIEGLCWEPKLRSVEWEVWGFVAAGLGNIEIGETCGFNTNYVAHIVGTLYRKLRVPDGAARRVKLTLMYSGRPNYPFHCLRCGRDFNSKVEVPAQCTKCHSQYWDTERTIRPKKDE